MLVSYMPKRIRAVAIVIDEGRLLLMHRWRPEKEYFVFPGGGVEPGESVEDAVIREICEEATLEIKIGKLLYRHIYDDDTEQYFYLCSRISGEPQLGDGPEFRNPNPDNRFNPEWVPAEDLSRLLVYPLEIRDWLIEDIKNGFKNGFREATLKVSDLRQML